MPRRGNVGGAIDSVARFVPRSVKGIVAVLVAFSMGASLSGAVLYTYYDNRKTQSEKRANAFVKNFQQRFSTAEKIIKAQTENAKTEIQEQIEPLRQIRAEGETLEKLVKDTAPSLFFVRSLDEAGAASVGTGFAVASDGDQTFVLTSFTTVRAATKRPGPQVVVRKGNQELKADLYTWEDAKDLALLVIAKGDIPKLSFAPRDPALKVGERVFSVSGLGSAGYAVSQGSVADVSANGIQHDAAVGQGFQGGPLVNSKGELLGVASRAYAPLGFTSEGVFFSLPIRGACEKVLRCPDDNVAGAGARR